MNVNTKQLANLVIEGYDTPKEVIRTTWLENNKHDAFIIFKDLIKDYICVRWSKTDLKRKSNQFIGYTAHYIIAHCIELYGTNVNP